MAESMDNIVNPNCPNRGIPPARDSFGNLGYACVYLDRWGTYTGHVANYGVHTERAQMKESSKDGFRVSVPIRTWDRVDIVKEAYRIFHAPNTAPEGYKDPHRDWGPIEQFLQTHPSCTWFDLKMYPDHPDHGPQCKECVAPPSLSSDNTDCVPGDAMHPPKRPRLH